MKIVYMGTPEFARLPLIHLCESGHEILAVVTGPDKVAGRGHKLIQTPVRQEAERRGIHVLMPTSLKSESFYESLSRFDADLYVVIAFRILPESVFSLPKFGAINIHGSLLPQYRGAAPINWALINGETETGLTSFFLKKSVDTGDMILQEKTPISSDDTYDTLALKMSQQTGPFLLKTLDLIEKGHASTVKQDDRKVSFAPKITADNSMIDFGFPAINVRNFVRGLSSKPGAYTFFRGAKMKILAGSIGENSGEKGLRPGTILPDKKQFLVQCRDSVIKLERVVPSGKAEMNGQAFLNGFKPNQYELLGEFKVGEKETK